MQWLLDRFATARGRLAFANAGREVSYGTLLDKIDECLAVISASGVLQGETVAILGDYSPEVYCLILALVRHNCIVVPLSRESVVEVSAALEVSGCDWWAEFDASNTEVKLERRRIEAGSEMLISFKKSLAPGLVLFSSGSTGTPKGILHDFNRVIEKFRKQRSPVVAIPFLMIDHFGGINTMLAITSSLGVIVTVSDRSIASICAAIERYHVDLLPATPSFLTLLIAAQAHRKYDLSSIRRITYGTEVMPQTTLDRVRVEFPGVELQQTYGLSEVGVLRSQSRDDGSLWVRVGGQGFETKVVDDILFVRSEYRMVGYLNAESNFDDEGWFNTQDRVEVDGDYIRILGRITDLINVGGRKVYPTEIEDVILSLENVSDVAVYGEAHALLGSLVVAQIVTTHNESIESVRRRVRRACKEKLAPFKVPAKVVLATGPLHSSRHKKDRRAR